MAIRHLYIARHGDADPFGELTDTGRQQARLLGDRLAHLPIDAIWHSPLLRATASAKEIAKRLTSDAPVAEAPELIDHIPYVPSPAETPTSWVPFFDGYDAEEAAAGNRVAESLTARFGTPTDQDADIHEVLITHTYPIAWLLRHALDAPPARWLDLNSANTALTVIEYRHGLPPGIIMFNDMSHLPIDLWWTGFPDAARP